MKKVYESPKFVAEAFMANEYVAACYKIKCTTPNNNATYYYLYNDTNENGKLDSEDELLYSRSYGFYGCNKSHPGVIRDEAPTANGFVAKRKYGSKDGANESAVFWWNEDLGSAADYHVMTPGRENYETNPNAS